MVAPLLFRFFWKYLLMINFEDLMLIDPFRYIVFPPRNFGLEMTFATRHAHRAPRHALGPSASCTGYTLSYLYPQAVTHFPKVEIVSIPIRVDFLGFLFVLCAVRRASSAPTGQWAPAMVSPLIKPSCRC